MAQLRDRAPEIDATGSAIAAIGCGPIADAEALREEFALPFPVYADPERKTFSAISLRRDLLGIASPLAAGHALRAWMSGARQRGVRGDALQLGGTFVITPSGDTPFAHRSREAGDHPEWEPLLAALA